MNKQTGKIILSLAVFLLFGAVAAQAATFTVTNTNNTGAGSLRQAVLDANAAAGADTIVFDAGVFSTPQTITLASVISINGVNDTLTITGPGANLLTVSGNNAVQIFSIIAGEITSISGMTITAALGGAVANGATLTVTNIVFDANTDSNGGAITNSGVSLTVTGCTFSNNSNTGGAVNAPGGAAIYNTSLATINNSTFTNNSATIGAGGGAIDNRGMMTINDSTFTGNSTTATGQNSRGGAINVQGGGQLTINNSLLTGNSSKKEGGAIYYQPNGGTPFLVINNSTFSNNTANSDNDTTGSGGALFLTGLGSVTITGSTFNGNQTLGRQGGAIDNSTVLNLTNSTISGNTAGSSGGGIYASGVSTAVVTIESSTIVNNTSTLAGGGVVRASTTNPVNFHNTIVANNTDNGTAPDISGSVVSQGYNLFETTTGATITGSTVGNITAQDPNLGPLQNNGGQTLTHALLAGSPAIDAGDLSNFPATDQRGVMRPVDGNPGNLIAQPDIGAFEFTFPPTAANVAVAGVVSDGFSAISRATVVLTDSQGVSRTVKTNNFGYFHFDEVPVGQIYVVSVRSKLYLFTPQIIAVNDSVTDLVFTPQSENKTENRLKMPL